MATDPNPELRAELEAALAVLEPQIRGLHDLEGVSISADLLSEVAAEVVDRERRRDLIQAVLDALDAVVAALVLLEADGYPRLPDEEVSAALFAELQEEKSDLEAAIEVFAQSMASTMTIRLGDPEPKS